MSSPAPPSLATCALLLVPPVLWAGNAVVGRLAGDWMPPVLLNLVRWALAFVLLLPLAAWVLRPGSGLRQAWRRYALLGLLGVGCYNALQYLALRTSTPINVTLVAASMPVFMLALGALAFGQPVRPRQWAGAAISIGGVLVVLARGDPGHLLRLRLVPGDFYILLAVLAWAWYSWLLSRAEQDPPALRADWAAFLMAQVVPGLAWSALFASAEWAVHEARGLAYAVQWGWPLAATLLYVAVGPAILAYRCWGLGVQRAGPAVAAFFANLTPLFAALFSALLLGQMPRPYHALAFALIAGGIVLASRR